MPKSEPHDPLSPATKDYVDGAAAIVIAALACLITLAMIVTHYRITRALDAVGRIEQKVNQCRP